jgi:hypothetical protein
MKYALFDEQGVLETCLIGGLHAIPARATELSEDLFYRITQETDGQWIIDSAGVISKQALPETAPNLARLIAAERYKREGVGITVNGDVIETTRDGQALIAGAAVSAILDPAYKCNWKTASGFVELTAPQLIVIATAVRAHVQACFDRELALLQAIEAGTYSDSMLAEGWPDSSPPDQDPVEPE